MHIEENEVNDMIILSYFAFAYESRALGLAHCVLITCVTNNQQVANKLPSYNCLIALLS